MTSTATIIIILKNLTLSRLLSQQVAAYFPVLLGTGVTTSLCCAQAPSPKAVTSTATIMIILKNLIFSPPFLAGYCPVLGGEIRGRNAFFFIFYNLRAVHFIPR